MLIVMFAISAALIACGFGACSPRRAMQRARMRLEGPPIVFGEASGVGC